MSFNIFNCFVKSAPGFPTNVFCFWVKNCSKMAPTPPRSKKLQNANFNCLEFGERSIKSSRLKSFDQESGAKFFNLLILICILFLLLLDWPYKNKKAWQLGSVGQKPIKIQPARNSIGINNSVRLNHDTIHYSRP